MQAKEEIAIKFMKGNTYSGVEELNSMLPLHS